jgi:prepilin-type N-terminal cleavage/methylation domain-containing protein
VKNCSPSFTLVELLVVIAILGLLASLMSPVIQKVRSQTESTVCISNLKNIGTAIWLWIPDNGNQYPRIENDPTHPIYDPDDEAKTLYETLKNYGITTNVLACPGDLKSQTKYYAKYTNSYECPPWAGDESVASGQIPIYRPGGTFQIASSRVTLAWDYENVHDGGYNRLKADNTIEHKSMKTSYK